MSDYDRGAYTPPTDEPLSFDARSPQRRRPMPTTLIASVVVLAVLVGALFVFYQSGARGANEPPRAVGKSMASIKTAPPVEDAKPVGDQPLDVYVTDKNAPAAQTPNFAPAPEPRPPRAVRWCRSGPSPRPPSPTRSSPRSAPASRASPPATPNGSSPSRGTATPSIAPPSPAIPSRRRTPSARR